MNKINRKFVGILSVFVVIVGLISYTYVVLKVQEDKSITIFDDMVQEKMVIYYGDEVIQKIPFRYREDTQSSYNGDKKIIIAKEDDETNTLIFINKEGAVEVDKEIGLAYLASEGSAIVYSDQKGIYRYDCLEGKKEVIELNDNFRLGASMAISPDGQSVIYTSVEAEDEMKFYIYEKGRSKLIGRNLEAIGISNNGECIYACDTYIGEKDNKEYVYIMDKKGNNKKRIPKAYLPIFAFNKDATQLMVLSEEESYIIERGDSIKEIASGIPIIPSSVARNIKQVYSGTCIYYELQSLLGQFFYTKIDSDDGIGTGISYVDLEGKTLQLEENVVGDVTYGPQGNMIVQNIEANSKGDIVCFIQENNGQKVLYKVADKKKELVAKNINNFKISADGKQIYYVDRDNVLWCKQENKKAYKVSNDVVGYEIHNDNEIYILNKFNKDKGSLYVYKATNKLALVEEDISILCKKNNKIYYCKIKDDNSDIVSVYSNILVDKFIQLGEIKKEHLAGLLEN